MTPAPLCRGCRKPVKEWQTLPVKEKDWHPECLEAARIRAISDFAMSLDAEELEWRHGAR